MALETQASQAAENATFKLPVMVDPAARQQAKEKFHYTENCARWPQAAVLGANNGLVSIASFMMSVRAIKIDTEAMILYGFAAFIAGACSMAFGEFVSVYSQFDTEQMKIRVKEEELDHSNSQKSVFLSAMQAAVVSTLAFSVGAVVPLLAVALISNNQLVRLGMVASATLALLVFSAVGAKLSKALMARSCVRVLLGDWLVMLITFGIMKLFGSVGL